MNDIRQMDRAAPGRVVAFAAMLVAAMLVVAVLPSLVTVFTR